MQFIHDTKDPYAGFGVRSANGSVVWWSSLLNGIFRVSIDDSDIEDCTGLYVLLRNPTAYTRLMGATREIPV
jgi:hypothetical protein